MPDEGQPPLAPPSWPTGRDDTVPMDTTPPPPSAPRSSPPPSAHQDALRGDQLPPPSWPNPSGSQEPWLQPPAPPSTPPDGGSGGGRRGIVIGVVAVVGVLALVLAMGAGWLGTRGGGDDPFAGADPTAPAVPDPDDPGGLDPEAPQGGLGGGPGQDPLAVDPSLPNPLPSPGSEEIEALEDIFEIIDDAELEMLDFMFESPVADDGSLTESELALARDVANEAVEELRALQDELETAGTAGGANAAIRAAYLVHLQDWIDWTGAVAEDPTLLIVGSGAYGTAISESADGFTASIRDSLGDLSTLPPDLAALVTEIVVRGFMGSGGDSQADI